MAAISIRPKIVEQEVVLNSVQGRREKKTLILLHSPRLINKLFVL